MLRDSLKRLRSSRPNRPAKSSRLFAATRTRAWSWAPHTASPARRKRPYGAPKRQLQVRCRPHGLCDLLDRVPPGRRKPGIRCGDQGDQGDLPAVPGRLSEELRARLEDAVAESPPAVEWCFVRRRLG